MIDIRHLPRSLATALRKRYRMAARLVAVVLPAAISGAAWSQEGAYDASEVKAAFLYHFGTYVQWPAAASATDPITIVVLGDDAVAAHLARFLPGRRISGRPVQARVITRVEELADDEIFFIGSVNNSRLAEITAAVARRPVLVVTDAFDGLEQGAIVNFQEVDARVRFEISLPRAEEAGLVLSSRLLAAALRVAQRALIERTGRVYVATSWPPVTRAPHGGR